MLPLKKTAYEIQECLVGSEMCIRDRLEACDCLKPLSIYFNLYVVAAGAVCHQLGPLGTDLHDVCGGFVETLN